MKLSKAEAERLQAYIAERCNRPDWKTPNPLEECYANFLGNLILATAVLWIIVLLIAILYHTLFWGVMLALTVCVVWFSLREMLQRLSDMIQTLGTTLRAIDSTERKSFHFK
jgi:hypothetical protein